MCACKDYKCTEDPKFELKKLEHNTKDKAVKDAMNKEVERAMNCAIKLKKG